MSERQVVAEYHGVEILDVPELSEGMIGNIRKGGYERMEVQLTLQYMPSGARIIEMGAGVGIVGAIAAKNTAPEAMLSYEGNHRLMNSIAALHAHNGLDQLIQTHNEILLSEPDAPDHVTFNIRGNFLGSGMVIQSGQSRAEKVDVPVARWAEVKADFKPTALLMDIEGAELEFFQNADLSGIDTVIFEIHRGVYGREGAVAIKRALIDQGLTQKHQEGGVLAFVRDGAAE